MTGGPYHATLASSAAADVDRGFHARDAGWLMRCERAEVGELAHTDGLIIEDEPMIAMDPETLVIDLGHRVTDIAVTHAEAVLSERRSGPASSKSVWPTAAAASMRCRSYRPTSTCRSSLSLLSRTADRRTP